MSKFITNLLHTGESLQPTIVFSDGTELQPLSATLSLRFDLTERFCTGWHDMATGENHPCPEAAKTDKKYSVCPACQRRTGFNPAFYHSATVSPQQEIRNAEPHHLYLASMGEGYIKVGISWHGRGTRRLLDQGARAGLILETFPTALIARQYEAKIARMSGIHETTSTRVKLALLEKPFRQAHAAKELLVTKQGIENEQAVSFSGSEVLFFDEYYAQSPIVPGTITPLTSPAVSGTVVALVGDILMTHYDDRRLALPLKQYIGYPVEVTSEPLQLDLKPQQMQLF